MPDAPEAPGGTDRPPGPGGPGGPVGPGGGRGYWSTVAGVLTGRVGIVSVVLVVVTVVLGLGITRLEFRTGQDSYLNTSSQVYKDNVTYQSLFGGEAMLSVYTMNGGKPLTDLFTPHNITEFQNLQKKLDADPRIASTITPLTALEWTNNLVTGAGGNPLSSPAAKILLGAQSRDPSPAGKKARGDDAIKTLTRIQAVPVAQRVFTNPAWINVLLYDNTGAVRKSLEPFFPNKANAQTVVRLAGNATLDQEGQGAKLVENAAGATRWDNANVVTTGAPALLRDINNYLRGGFLSLGGIALALMAGLLLALFAVRWRLLPLGVVAVGLVWAFGLAGYLNIPLTVVTIAGLPVLLGVGTDFAVQLHSRIEEEAGLDRAEHPVTETLVRLMPALAIATVAAVLSFLALEFSAVPMLRDFGTLLALGLPVIVVATVAITSTSLAWRERRSPTQPRDYTHGPLGRAVVGLGSLPRATAAALVVLSVAVFVGGAFAENHLKVQTDPQRWVSQDSQTVKNITQVQDRVGASSELGIFITSTDLFSDTTARFVDDFAARQLAAHPRELVGAASLVTVVSYLADVPGATHVAPTGAEVAAAYAVEPPDLKQSTVNSGGHAFNLIFRVSPISLEQLKGVVNDVRATTAAPAGVSATPSGLAVVGVGLLNNIESNRVALTYYALAAVFVFLALCYLNVVRALLSIVPVLIAVGLAALISWAIHVDLSPLTVVSGPLVIALCTEFTTLIVMRYLEERRRGHGPEEAMEMSASRTGRAFVVSAAAAVIGILVLAFSSMPLLRDFGLVVALNVAVALLSALIVLPPLLVAADHRGWVHRRGEPAPDAGWSRGLGPSASAGPSGPGAAGSARTGGRRKRRDGR